MHHIVTLASLQNQASQGPLGCETSLNKTLTRAVPFGTSKLPSRSSSLVVGLTVAVLAASAGTARAEELRSDGRYTIKNRLTSSVIDNRSGGAYNAEIHVEPNPFNEQGNSPEGQKWRLVDKGDGLWEIRNESGYLCLTHDYSSDVIFQDVCINHDGQRFKLVPSPYYAGYFHIQSKYTSRFLSTYACTDSTSTKLGATKTSVMGNGCDEWLFERTDYMVRARTFELPPRQSDIHYGYDCTYGWHFRTDPLTGFVAIDNYGPSDVQARANNPFNTPYFTNLDIFYENVSWTDSAWAKARYYCDIN